MKQLLSAFLLMFVAAQAWASDRVALVIGNSHYANATTLENPSNDAKAVAAKLRAVGFEVFHHEDLTGQTFRIALGEFTEAALNSEIALVFYAGHGIEMDGRNYLIPVDAKMESQATAQFETVSLDGVLSTVRQAGKLGMVLLDACRDNPFANTMKRTHGTRAVSRGLASVSIEQETGILVSFAAQAGNTADDGAGMHSPYTEALLSVMDEPGLEINQVFRKVRARVVEATGGKQTPIERMQLPDEDIYLVPAAFAPTPKPTDPTPAPSPQTPSQPAPQEDPLLVFLEAIQSEDDDGLQDFIRRYPDHPKADDARKILTNRADTQFWNKTVAKDTAEGYRAYILVFSDGAYVSQATERLAAMTQPVPVPTPVPTTPIPVARPSYDCNRAQTANEHAICGDANLAYLDREIAAQYKTLTSLLSGSRLNALKSDQRSWISQRETCGSSTACLTNIMQQRVDVLRQRVQSGSVPAPTPAPSNGIQTWCQPQNGQWSVQNVRSNDTLFVRAGPSKNYNAIGELPYNAQGIKDVSCNSGGWCSVTYGCIRGYSFGKYLGNRSNIHGRGNFEGQYSVTDHPSNQKLNVRSGPGTKYAVVAELRHDATNVTVTDCQKIGSNRYRWCAVSNGTISGWAYGKYLRDWRGQKPLP